MTKFFFALACCFCFSQSFAQHQLVKLWETDSIFRIPESVLYDASSGFMYVSNVGDFQKQEAGFISKLDKSGKIIAQQWVRGLTAPKGMALHKGVLYVSELTAVAAIDVSSGAVINRIKVEGSQFLNDVTVNKKGIVYVSDSRANKVFLIRNNTAQLFRDGLKSVNGLLAKDRCLYMLADASLWRVNKKGKTEKLASNLDGGADGIEPIDKKSFIISCWTGLVYHVKANGEKQLLLDTRDKKINAADIGFNTAEKIVYVPTFSKHTVAAYKLN